MPGYPIYLIIETREYFEMQSPENKYEPILTCPKCEVKFEDKPPLPLLLRILVILAALTVFVAAEIFIGLELKWNMDNIPLYQPAKWVIWVELAAFFLLPAFSIWFLIAHRWKRTCPGCANNFVIPKGRRTNHYSWNPLYYPFQLIGKMFPTLISPTKETEKQSMFITMLCTMVIALTLIGFNLLNEWLGPKIFEPWGTSADVLPSILHWHTTFYICLTLIAIIWIGYAFRRYAITPFLLLLVLICAEVICAFILVLPMLPYQLMAAIDNDTPLGWRGFGREGRPEFKFIFALNDPGKSAAHRNALVDRLEKHPRPWMKKHIENLLKMEGDKEIRERLSGLLEKMERLNE